MAIAEGVKVERHGIILLLKTERGKGFISSIARFRFFWKMVGSLGIVVGLLGMVLVVFSLFYAAYSTFILRLPVEGAKMVIPGVTIPFWYGLIGLISVLVVHEFSHGILAKSEGVPIKNIGAVIIGILPLGAFVEPDEEVFKNKGVFARMRVYAAGSFGNIIIYVLASIALVPVFLFPGHFLDLSKVNIAEVVKDSPSENILEKGMVLQEINGKSVSKPEDFFDVMGNVKPGDEVELKTDRGTFKVVAVEKKKEPNQGFIGIAVAHPFTGKISEIIVSSLSWIAFLNYGIGLINLAPLHLGIAATDGHNILKDIMSKLRVGDAERITTAVSVTMVLVLVLTMIGPSLVPPLSV